MRQTTIYLKQFLQKIYFIFNTVYFTFTNENYLSVLFQTNGDAISSLF